MDKHCVSLEISKDLKEAGWKEPTIYQWSDNYYGVLTFGKPAENFKGEYRIVDTPVMLDDTEYPAPLATEILEELPKTILKDNCRAVLEIRLHENTNDVCYYHPHTFTAETDKSLPNALALMWLYLKKNNLLTHST